MYFYTVLSVVFFNRREEGGSVLFHCSVFFFLDLAGNSHMMKWDAERKLKERRSYICSSESETFFLDQCRWFSFNFFFLIQMVLPLRSGLIGDTFRQITQTARRMCLVSHTACLVPSKYKKIPKQWPCDSLCLTVWNPLGDNWTQISNCTRNCEHAATTLRVANKKYAHIPCRISHKCFLSNISSE